MRSLVFMAMLMLGVFPQAVLAQTLLRPAHVFDGEAMHAGWVVLIDGAHITAVGPARSVSVPPRTEVIDLPGLTLLPGLIEGHSHLLLHPYDETPWTDQVLREALPVRVARGVVHAEATLFAGVTTARDLGSEGADFADVGLKQAIDQGIVPGPRLLVAGPAIVATGSYGPAGFDPRHAMPLGAVAADGYDALVREVRRQIGGGADLVKVYADYRWGPNGEAQPTFTLEELRTIVEVANSSGRPVVAHAATAEGMRRATMAGVQTIEHGDGGTPEVWALMAERGVGLCPTLAAVEAISQYQGWQPGTREPPRLQLKRKAFRDALAAGVPLCFGGDVGVYDHGDNVRELELMVAYGVPPLEAVRTATSGNAALFGLKDRGRIAPTLLADLIAVPADPTSDVAVLRDIRFVMKGGVTVRLPNQ